MPNASYARLMSDGEGLGGCAVTAGLATTRKYNHTDNVKSKEFKFGQIIKNRELYQIFG